MTDPIADMLTRIRNALRVHKSEVTIPYSKLKVKIAEILKNEGYINSYSEQIDSRQLKLQLKYQPNGQSVINSLRRISKPGRRIYCQADKLPRVLNNLGIAIISTPQGMMTVAEAKQKKIGGEIICEIY